MLSQLKIRRVVKSDESKIKDLFFSDVYHWTLWVWPIVRHGVLSLLAKPIIAIFCLIIAIGPWDLSLFLWLTAALIALMLLSVAKLVLFLAYFWYMPEFVANNLTEFYSQPGFAFFVAELHGRIVACVAVQRKEDKVAEIFRMAVSSRCQGLGVGKELLQVAVQFAEEKYERIVLETSYNQQQAKHFYEKNKFTLIDAYWNWFFFIPFYIYRFLYTG